MIDAEEKLKERRAESETEIKQKNKERDRLRRIIAGYGQHQISLYEKYKSGELSKDVYLERKAEIKKLSPMQRSRLLKLIKIRKSQRLFQMMRRSFLSKDISTSANMINGSWRP